MILLKSRMPARTRALLCFQYASGCRIGELLQYTHKICNKETNYQTKTYETNGLLITNIRKSEDIVQWEMPNFKVRKEERKIKYPFILKEERLLWIIANRWLKHCPKQVFNIRESMARKLIRKVLQPLGYSSKVLRSSRGTHLADKFDYNPYEIMDFLGHTNMQSGLSYITTANKVSKMRNKLKQIGGI